MEKVGHQKVIMALSSERAKFGAFILFLVLVFLLGGSSRDDLQSLIILRPLSVLFATYAISQSSWEDLKALGIPLYLLLALMFVMIVQLIPLPPTVWITLPMRQLVAQVSVLLDMEGVWRPLTLSPSKTWNSLLSLTVPLAGILLFNIQGKYHRSKTEALLIAIGICSAVWALMQLSGPERGPLYLYNVTNYGEAVGLFANRNHHGVFLGCVILCTGWFFASLKPKEKYAGLKASVAVGSISLLIPTIFMVGSRAGLFIGGLAVVGAFIFISRAKMVPDRIALTSRFSISRSMLLAIIFSAFLMAGSLAVLLSRSLALDRLLERDALGNLRSDLLPVFGEMIPQFFPYGAGFGSFEHVYKMFEPIELLDPRYLNLAHNDWAQWLIEGGLPGVIILTIFGIWYLVRAFNALRTDSSSKQSIQFLSLAVILFLVLASFVDYPLRVPSIMVFFAIFCARLEREARSLTKH